MNRPRGLARSFLGGCLLAAGAAAAAAPLRPVAAQEAPATDTLYLAELQAAAREHDPRAEQVELLGRQADLRLRNLALERLPSVRLHGQAQYQSDVASIPFELPGGQQPPLPPRDTYDAYLGLQQSLYDPSHQARQGLERARLEESRAGVRAALYELRGRVNEAYFGALLLDAQAAEVDAGLAALREQMDVAQARVEEGAALPSEAATIQREVLRRMQLADELDSAEATSRQVLAILTGQPLAARAPLSLPVLGEAVAAARAAMGGFEGRPEMARFARGREVLERRAEVIAAGERPRVSAFGRGGYGRPGLNPLAQDFDSYWLGGVQVDWAPWSWGATANERRELRLQSEILRSEEAAFVEQIRRGAITELATIDRLERSLERDAEIVALSEQILAETRLRFGEAAVTSAELVEREADLLRARLDTIQHRIELAHAHSRFLTLIGRELP